MNGKNKVLISVVPGIYPRVLFASISGVFWILASIYSYSQNIGYIASTNAEYFSSTSVKLSLYQRPQQSVAQYNYMYLKEALLRYELPQKDSATPARAQMHNSLISFTIL